MEPLAYDYFTKNESGKVSSPELPGDGSLLEFVGKPVSDFAGDVSNEIAGIGQSAPVQHGAKALERAMQAVSDAPDLPSGILSGASELYAGGLNITSDIAEALGMDMSNVPDYTGESATGFWKGLAGDEEAKKTPVTTRGGEETTLGDVAGYSEMEKIGADIKTGLEGALDAAKLGALTELWNKANTAASTPISGTANTIEQLMNIDNKRSI